MKKFSHYSLLLIAIALLYGGNRFLAGRIERPAFFAYWFNDLLAIPFLLFLFRFILLFIPNPYQTRPLPLYFIGTAVFFYAFWFEYFMPQNNASFRSDPIDVICYVAGGLSFYLFEKFALGQKKEGRA